VLESEANGGHVPVAPREIGANQRAEREQMRAVSRLWKALAAGALALVPAMALAQEAPPASSAPTDAVGPKELQNFTLNGTVTRPADQPVAVPPASTRRQPRAQAQSAPPPAVSRPSTAAAVQSALADAPVPRRSEAESAEAPPQRSSPSPSPEPIRQSPPSSSVTIALPKLDSGSVAASAASAPAAAPSFGPDPRPAGTLAPAHGFSLLPWLLAALALGAGGAFLFWRNRGHEAFAGGPQVDSFIAPVPPPAPRRTPSPPPQPASKPAPPALAGVVSTRLRPWIDVGFHPLRCILEDQRVIVQFEIELFNSGSAPARGVLVEATLFNAGQDAQIGNFFANPVGTGERIAAITPLKRITIRTQVAVPREQVQAYELAGRQVFVPVIAFNTLYSGSGGDGQTSVSYLLGRDTKGEKMGPFRFDLGPRIFRSVAARLLPAGIRR